jgi:hypothetical protein
MTRLSSTGATKELAPDYVAASATLIGLWGSTVIRPRNVVALSTARHMNPSSRWATPYTNLFTRENHETVDCTYRISCKRLR